VQGTENTAALLGRVAMSMIFIHGGWGKLLAPSGTRAILATHDLRMMQLSWILAVVVELGGGLAILFGLFTRPVGLVLAIWCVGHRPDCAYEFRRPQSGDPFLEKHGDDGRVCLRGRVRRPRLESRRMVVAPRCRSSGIERSPRPLFANPRPFYLVYRTVRPASAGAGARNPCRR
jgi:DoxX-like protein